DNTINLWYVDTGHLLQTITGNITDANPSIGVRAIALNPDGRTLAVATDEALVRLWDMPTGKIKTTLDTGKVAAVVFS
ncbi:WD40 repeat domain-containing protein, partial [Methylobacterium crusticola]|uniref:WD40 repeat domain-containing protein n=1 Tax=Methylobacterium crusticola TaxID=1697972 RepID=UPI0034D42FFD